MSIAETYEFISQNPFAREIAGEAAKSASQGTVLHWGARLGARLIPGVGTALLLYDVADVTDTVMGFGCKYLTGREWTDTAVGQTVHNGLQKTGAVASKATGYVVDGASSLLSTIGFGKAGEKVASWGKYLLCGDDGKPVPNETISKNPILTRGEEKPATSGDLPAMTHTGVTIGDLHRIAALKHRDPSQEPKIDTVALSSFAGSPASKPDLELALLDQDRLSRRAPETQGAALSRRLTILDTPADKRAAPTFTRANNEIGI